MPAPQASMMQQLARLKFSGNSIQSPISWQQPQGDPPGTHYNGKAFKDSEKSTMPDTTMPPLFNNASSNKYHTDTQKKLNDVIGKYLDGCCSAICSAWGQWQSAATIVGVVINGPVASGGTCQGPPLTPLIMSSIPMSTPAEMSYSNAIASVFGTAWTQFQATIMIPGLPFYPAYAAFPGPMAPPMPNPPVPLAALSPSGMSIISGPALKGQMVGQHGGKPTDQNMQQIYDAVTDAIDKCFKIWLPSTMVNNVLATVAPVPTFAPPYVPVGPVVGGVGMMAPGGFV